jgi:hypothetical protein
MATPEQLEALQAQEKVLQNQIASVKADLKTQAPVLKDAAADLSTDTKVIVADAKADISTVESDAKSLWSYAEGRIYKLAGAAAIVAAQAGAVGSSGKSSLTIAGAVVIAAHALADKYL